MLQVLFFFGEVFFSGIFQVSRFQNNKCMRREFSIGFVEKLLFFKFLRIFFSQLYLILDAKFFLKDKSRRLFSGFGCNNKIIRMIGRNFRKVCRLV